MTPDIEFEIDGMFNAVYTQGDKTITCPAVYAVDHFDGSVVLPCPHCDELERLRPVPGVIRSRCGRATFVLPEGGQHWTERTQEEINRDWMELTIIATSLPPASDELAPSAADTHAAECLMNSLDGIVQAIGRQPVNFDRDELTFVRESIRVGAEPDEILHAMNALPVGRRVRREPGHFDVLMALARGKGS